MMVTVEGSYNSGLSPLLSTLEDETSIIDDRVDAYLALTDRLRDDEHEILSKEICSKTSNLVCVYERDMLDDNNELSQAALQSLGFCVHHQDISKSISQKDSLTLVKALCNTLLKTTDKSTCTRALWCIAKQNFPHDSINNELHGILCAVEHALVKGGYQSMSVEHEAINAIITLLEQLPNSMKLHALRWGNLVLPLLLHSAHKIRERALHAMRLGFSALMSRQQELVKTLVSDIKSLFSQEMTKLFENQQELHVLTVWQYLIDLLGKALHKGGSLINSLLTIVERAFKSSIVQVKCAAFHAWQHLIDNFALDMEVLCNHKRMKLLLQPFKVTVSKQEAVAVAKLDAWWHFAQVFENRLAMTFDQICVPLLQFSLGLSSTNNIQCPSTPIVHQGAAGRLSTPTQQRNGAVSSPGTPYMNLAATNGSMSPVVTACNSLQMKGCEILAHLLRKTDLPADVVKMDFTLGPLKYPLINSSSVFIKVSVVLIHAVRETMCSYGNQIPETLVTFIWQCLSSHMKTLLDMGTKKDTVEIFTLYLASLQAIINSERFTPTYILKLIDIVSKLPQKALSSPAYHVGNAELMHGTPALFLIQQMFHYSFLENIISESYFCILEHLVERGMSNPTAVLGFAQSVLELLNTVTVTTDNSETIWRIWSIVVNPMLQHVVVTNEVNQGDSLDHDFSAMYIALVLPVKKLFISNVTQGTMKTLLKTWSDIYNTFARCCALVATADANVCCQDLCTKILQLVDMKILKDMRVVDALGHLCGIMLSSIDFSSYSYQQSASSNRAPFNPGNPTKKRYKHLGNITAFIQLVKNLLAALNTYSTCQDSVSQKHYSSDIQAWSSSINGMTNLLSTLFSHITMATMIQSILEELSQPIAALFVASSKPQTLGGLFTPAINQKLEKLWGDLLMLIESRHKAPFSTHFLKVMSPLLEVTLSDCKRSIRNRTVQFWNATFACADTLSYSDSLKTCLLKVKETTAISLPDIDEEEDKEEMEEEAEEEVIQIVEETPYSLGTDTEPSQVVVSRPQLHSILPTFGRGSPQKLVGSFLKKTALSPDRGSKLKRSPLSISKRSPGSMSKVKVSASKAKVVVAPSGAHARRKLPLSIDEDSRQVFVAISPSPKHKKFVLTEHQKEVLRSRKVVPTMYNDLDASLDTSYMAELLASQTQEFEPCDDEEVASTQAKRPRLDEENIDVNKLATQSFQKEKNRVSFAGLLTKSGSESASSDVEEKEKNARRVKLVKVTDSNTDNTRSVSGIKGINTAVKPLKGSEIDHKLVEMTQKLKESPKKQTEQTLSEEKESEKIGDNSKRKEIYNEEENVLDSTNEDIIAATPPPTEAQTISDARRRSLGFRASHPASDPAIKTSIAKKRKLGKDTSVEKSDTQAKSVPETQELRNSEVDETEVKTVPDSQVKSENMLTATSLLVDKQKLLTTPVLKLKRLSQEEIKKYSPKKAIQSESIPSDKQAEDKENSIPDASREIERTKMEDPCGDVAQDEPELQKRSTPRRSLLGSSVRNLENKDDIGGVVPFPEQQTRKEGIQVESGNEMPMDLECAQINSQDYVGDVSSQDSEPLVNIQRKRRSKKSDKVNVVISSEDSQEDMTPRRSSRRSTSRKSLPTVEEHSETVPSSWKESSSNQIPERRKSRRLSQYSEVEKDKGVSRSNKVMKGHSSQERESQFSQNVEAEQVDEKSKTISSENADEILTFASPSADEEEETEIFFRIDPASLEVDSELSDVEVLPVEDVDKSDIPKTQELKKPDTPPESDSEEATVEISNKNKNKMADKTPTRKSTRIVGKKNKRSPQQTIAKKLLNKVMKSPREKSATRLTNKRTVGSSVSEKKGKSPMVTKRLRSSGMHVKTEENVLSEKPGDKNVIANDKNDNDNDEDYLPLTEFVSKQKNLNSKNADEVSNDVDECSMQTDKMDDVVESSQSPEKNSIPASESLPNKTKTDVKFSSPQHSTSPVNRRFVFPKLSNYSSPSAREKLLRKPSSPQSAMAILAKLANQQSPAHTLINSEESSPKTSPGGGILKRGHSDSPSPPNKMRRVSFAEPLEHNETPQDSPSSSGNKTVSRCLEMTKTSLPPSPLVTTTPSKVMTSQSKYITTPSRQPVSDSILSASSHKSSPSLREGLVTPTSNTRRRRFVRVDNSQASSQEAEEWNSQEQVFPFLNECKSPVEAVLPQLTSSIWSRGLGQLVRARNIHTVGNLCSLTCGQVQNLPIRSPKVETLRNAMQHFQKQLDRTNKSSKSQIQQTGSVQNLLKDEDGNKAVLEDSDQLLKDVNNLSESACNESSEKVSSETRQTCDALEETPKQDISETCEINNVASPPPAKKRLVEILSDLRDDFTEKNLSELSSEEIFQAHNHVSSLMSTIVEALKSRCGKPTS